MKFNTYLVHSPKFPKRKDFGAFAAWCQWDDAKEINYLRIICGSILEYEMKVMNPYKRGKDTYYPIYKGEELPPHKLLFVKAQLKVDSESVDGFVSLVDGVVEGVTVWVDENPDNNIILSNDAKDNNAKAIKALIKFLKAESVEKIKYDTDYLLHDGSKIKGTYKV